MRLTSIPLKLAGIAISVALLGGAPAFAETVKLSASLDGAQQSPPVTTDATGSADLSYDTDSRTLEWTIEYSGLSGAPGAGHFHGPADPGENAGVAVPLGDNLASPITGQATLTEEQAAALLDGKLYLNLHTAANPGGEIRGQVTKAGM